MQTVNNKFIVKIIIDKKKKFKRTESVKISNNTKPVGHAIDLHSTDVEISSAGS
jgi:hypothetical protein